MLSQGSGRHYLYMLAGLDQLSHEALQLIVPLDQAAEVRIQSLLQTNQTEKA